MWDTEAEGKDGTYTATGNWLLVTGKGAQSNRCTDAPLRRAEVKVTVKVRAWLLKSKYLCINNAMMHKIQMCCIFL